VLVPEVTEGPYFVDAKPDRSASAPTPRAVPPRGHPLRLKVSVVDVGAAGKCTPYEGATVDTWHCDADGVYSGVDDPQNPGGADSIYGETGGTSLVNMKGIRPGGYPETVTLGISDLPDNEDEGAARVRGRVLGLAWTFDGRGRRVLRARLDLDEPMKRDREDRARRPDPGRAKDREAAQGRPNAPPPARQRSAPGSGDRKARLPGSRLGCQDRTSPCADTYPPMID
jgi:Dioxygenase